MGDYRRNPFYFEITIAVLWASTLMDNHVPLSLYDPITKPNVDLFWEGYYMINVKQNDYVKVYCLYLLLIQYQETRSPPTRNEDCQTLTVECHHDHVRYLPSQRFSTSIIPDWFSHNEYGDSLIKVPVQKTLKEERIMYATFLTMTPL